MPPKATKMPETPSSDSDDDQEAGDGAAAQGDRQRLAQAPRAAAAAVRRFDLHRDVHADEAGESREECADEKGNRRANTAPRILEGGNQYAKDDRADDREESDRLILPPQVGVRALEDRAADLLHLRSAGIAPQHVARQEEGEDYPDNADDRHRPDEKILHAAPPTHHNPRTAASRNERRARRRAARCRNVHLTADLLRIPRPAQQKDCGPSRSPITRLRILSQAARQCKTRRGS